MGTRVFSTLVPRIQASVPGCPQATIVQYIRDAAIRTCERTLYWRYQIPLFDLSPGVSEYAFNKPTNADVHVVFEALVNGRPLKRLTMENAIELYPQWADLFSGMSLEDAWHFDSSNQYNTNVYDDKQFNASGGATLDAAALDAASAPQAICQITPERYVVLPLPDDSKAYTCRMFTALKPAHGATGMDEFTFNELEEVIMHGTLQHLLVLPQAAWSDRELAAYHAKQYVFQVAERRARANLGNVRGMLQVHMQPFGA